MSYSTHQAGSRYQNGCRCSDCREAHRLRRRDEAQKRHEFVRVLKNKPCADCKKTFPHYVMQFDHVPEKGEKLFMIGDGQYYSRARTLAEAEKCDVVCANCHAIRTWNRRH